MKFRVTFSFVAGVRQKGINGFSIAYKQNANDGKSHTKSCVNVEESTYQSRCKG